MNKSVFPLILLFMELTTGKVYAQNFNGMKAQQLQYKINGTGDWLVLVPGGLTGWASWDPFVPSFSTSNKVMQVQLISVQFGLEDVELPNNYSVNLESEALFQSLKDVGINSSVDFIGWSYGALVLLDFALKHSDLVKSLTLIEPPAFWIITAKGKVDQKTKETMEYLKTISGDISLDQLEGFMVAVGLGQPGISVREMPQWENWVDYRKSLKNCSYAVTHNDDISKLKDLDKPVLLVSGIGSSAFFREILLELEKELPNAQMIELEGGHAPHIVSKDEFFEAYKQFRGI